MGTETGNVTNEPAILEEADALAWLESCADGVFDLVIGSPPYAGKGKRYAGAKFLEDPRAWAEWMAAITIQAARVSRGRVVWVVDDSVVGGRWRPAVPRLICLLDDAGLFLERPVIWTKNAAPNAGKHRPWFCHAWESVLAVRVADVPTWEWERIAEPPKYADGGRFRQRAANGGERRAGGEYPTVALARPRDVIRVPVGGGMMGHPLAHQGEAPYPEKLVAPFVQALTNPGDAILDPFVGTGTTCSVASRAGRRSVGLDCRREQIAVAADRLIAQGVPVAIRARA